MGKEKKIYVGKYNSNSSYNNLDIFASRGLHDYIMEVIKKDIDKNSTILILGSGSGAFDNRLYDNGYENITTVDINNLNYKYKNDNIDFIESNLNYNFSNDINKTFDLIIGIEVIEHLYSPYNFLNESKKLLNTNGKFLISTPNIHNLQSRLNFLLLGYPTYFITKVSLYGHISPIFNNILLHLLEQTNLKLINRYGVGNYFKNFKFYGIRSYFYFLLMLILTVLLYPITIFNRKLLKGTNTIYILKNT